MGSGSTSSVDRGPLNRIQAPARGLPSSHTCALRRSKKHKRHSIEGFDTTLSLASRSEMLQRQPFRSHVYKPFLSIGCLCLLERLHIVGAQPCPSVSHPRVVLVLGVVPAFCKMTPEPRWGALLLREVPFGGTRASIHFPPHDGTSPGRAMVTAEA